MNIVEFRELLGYNGNVVVSEVDLTLEIAGLENINTIVNLENFLEYESYF